MLLDVAHGLESVLFQFAHPADQAPFLTAKKWQKHRVKLPCSLHLYIPIAIGSSGSLVLKANSDVSDLLLLSSSF